jgi:uncharacterized iron-regulated membrane protein
MNIWNRCLRQPQSVLLRRIFFQIHLWIGVALGLYVVMISLTGSALVFRREIIAMAGPVYVTPGERRLTVDELGAIVQRAYPGFSVEQTSTPRRDGRAALDQAIEVRLRRGDATIGRLFDPYTGADLGSSERMVVSFILWLADLHDNLLAGETGRLINGIAAILVTLLTCAGAIIWWPGIRNWKRSLMIDWRQNYYGLNWSLHSAVGFWMFSLVLLWGISGIYFSFPLAFNAIVDYFEPLNGTRTQVRIGDEALSWIARLHFGRFSGWTVKALWTVLGLAPALLAITGTLMWWRRVVRGRLQRRLQAQAFQPAAHPVKGAFLGDEPNEGSVT